MREFTDLQQRSAQLPKRVLALQNSRGCLSFFSALPQMVCKTQIMPLAMKISVFSQRLAAEESLDIPCSKAQVLLGLYLYHWSQLDTATLALLNQDLITLFQEDLDVQGIDKLDGEIYGKAITALDSFCKNYYNRYKDLLPETILSDLLLLRSNQNKQSSWGKNIQDLGQALGF